MRITFRGATRRVTGSQYFVETDQVRFLVECGLNQGPEDRGEQNRRPFGFEPASLDFLLLTHAHLDHCGLISRLCREGFRGPIYSTLPTLDLATIVLLDSAKIQQEDWRFEMRRWRRQRLPGPPPEPLYTIQDASESLALFQPQEYDQVFSPAPEVRCCFHEAGHILGASTLELWLQDEGRTRTVVFSGDLGHADRPLMRDPHPPGPAEVVVMEGTYGDRLRQPREEAVEILRQRLSETLGRGGHVIIPAFAIDRTQEVLYTLSRLRRADLLPPVPVYVDSPMALEATRVFERHVEYLDSEAHELVAQGQSPFQFPGLHLLRTAEQSRSLNEMVEPFIVVSSSGMCSGGRIRHHLHHHLEHPDDELLFVGYQAEETPGRELVDGASELTVFGQAHPVRCRITYLDGFSAHADQPSLIAWAKQVTAPGGRVLLVHGESEALDTLAGLLTEEMGEDRQVAIPEPDEEVVV